VGAQPLSGTHPWVGMEVEACWGWTAGRFSSREASRSGCVPGRLSFLPCDEVRQVSAEPPWGSSCWNPPVLQTCGPARCQAGGRGVWGHGARHGLGRAQQWCWWLFIPQVRKLSAGKEREEGAGAVPGTGAGGMLPETAPSHPHTCGPSGP